MHDPDTMQREHPIPQDLAHAPDLSIASFGEDDAEPCGTDSFNQAGFGRTVENDDPLSHAVNERLIEWMIDRHLVFPFMPVLGSQDLVHDVPVVREKNEAGGVLVESADRKDPLRMADLRDDVTGHMRLTGRRHAHWFVILDVERGSPPGNHLAVSRDDVLRTDLISQRRYPLIDGHATGFDQTISLSPRTDAVVCKKLIDAKLVGHSVGMPVQWTRRPALIRPSMR